MKMPEALQGFETGETPLGTLRTAGTAVFHDDAGEREVAPLWFVLCPTRAWLVAIGSHGQWATASAEVILDKGWTWDALKVGPYSATLRAGTRGSAVALMEKWAEAPKGGDFEPAPRQQLPAERAPAANGAQGVPDWIVDGVPADPEERWLFAFESAREHAFVDRDGSLAEPNTWFALTDRRMVLAAEGPDGEIFVRQVTEVAHHHRAGRRDRLSADGWVLPGALVGDRKTGAAGELAAVSGPKRWAVALRQALQAEDFERAHDLVAEAFVLGRHTASWSSIGAMAMERSPGAAVGAVLRALEAEPNLVLRDRALDWARSRRSLRSAPALPAGVRAECTLPELPDGLPWPPTGPFEVFGTAAILRDRSDDGLALWAHLGDTPRVRQAIAATETARGAEDAWQSWSDAALRWRPEEPETAREALDRAIAIAPSPQLQWRAAAWAHADGADPIPFWDEALSSGLPAALEQPVDTWRALARHAESVEAWTVAAEAWERVRTEDPDALAALLQEATVRETRLGDLPGAVAAYELLAARLRDVTDPEPTRWHVWTEIARLRIELSALGQAEDALREALVGDFLVPEAYTRVLELADRIDTDAKDWWRHLQAQLTSAPASPPRLPAESLSDDVLDALHPGGVGWLDKARHSLDTSDPPPRADLVRGLERIQSTRWPLLTERIDAISAALHIDPPETYLFRGEGAWGLSAWPTDPPLVLVGHHHLDENDPQFLSRPALHFALAVEIVHLAERHPLLAFDGGLVGTSRSVYQAFGKYAGAAETVVDVVTLLPGVDQLAKIQTLVKLSKRVFTARSVIDKATGAADSTANLFGWSADETQSVARSFEGAALQFRIQADRAALLLTGDLGAAIEAILKGTPETASLHANATADGLLSIFPLLDADTRLRLAALLEFAAGR